MSQITLEENPRIASQRLERLLTSATVMCDGTVMETKQVVSTIDSNKKIHIYLNEHAPPHFHVKYAGYEGSFAIEDCQYLKGNIPKKDCVIIKYWYDTYNGRSLLVKNWNNTRPTDCPVGEINLS